MQIILIFIGIVLSMMGVIMIYDARVITKKFFGFGDQNEAACGLKILGFLIAMVGSFIIFFQK